MSKWFIPVQDAGESIAAGGSGRYIPHSYGTHGWSKIDWNVGGGKTVQAITGGTLVGVYGRNADGETGFVVVIESDRTAKNGKFCINYLELAGLYGKFAEIAEVESGEIIYTGNMTGPIVNKTVYTQNITISQGEKIGITNGYYSGSNVHIDFTLGNRYDPSQPPDRPGYANNNRDSVPQVSADLFNKTDYCDREYVWDVSGNNTPWSFSDGSTAILSYLVQCAPVKQIQSVAGSDYNATLDVTKIMALNDNDWLAIYGMLIYEEGGIFDHDDTLTATAICEWVMRVFRNRLLSGTSVESICQWDSGRPGRATAESKGRTAGDTYKQIAQSIISGNNLWAVEQKAKALGGTNFSSKKCSYGTDNYLIRLQAADTFSGGKNQRWGTLVDIPFNHGGRFFCEDEFSTRVANKFSTGFFNGTQCSLEKWNSF